MDFKESIIDGFESCYWEIDVGIKEMLFALPTAQFLDKIVEWQNWAEIGGRIDFKK